MTTIFQKTLNAAANTQVKRTTPDSYNFSTRESYKTKLSGCFCTDHTGKMSGGASVSTSVALNARCAARAKDPESICAHCFAAAMLEYYTELGSKLARNTELLTGELLTPADIPIINGDKFGFLRFESFGDLNNEIQVYNYFLTAAVNNHMPAALWTKNPDIIAAAMKKYGIKKPSNLVIIYSSPKVNKPARDMLQKYDFIDKIFTVYESEETAAAAGVKINCGARDCSTCKRCYTRRTRTEVNELLK